MAKFQHPVQSGFSDKQFDTNEVGFVPYWARCQVQYAQNLLECSDEPIVYDHNDEDYQDNCFFFPEDCSWSPPKEWVVDNSFDTETETDTTSDSRGTYDETEEYEDYSDNGNMIPGLPDIKMLDAEALGDLLEDNLSPPEITSIMVFATNGAIFAHATPLPLRKLRDLSATYGAAYTSFAKTVSGGNLTGVNPASHPSSYVTAQSISLGEVGSIVFEDEGLSAVITRIADNVLLAAIGPSTLNPNQPATNTTGGSLVNINAQSNAAPEPSETTANGNGNGNGGTSGNGNSNDNGNGNGKGDSLTAHLENQYQIDRTSDLARLESLNLSASPAILLALESKSAALGKFLGRKLADLESPEDF